MLSWKHRQFYFFLQVFVIFSPLYKSFQIKLPLTVKSSKCQSLRGIVNVLLTLQSSNLGKDKRTKNHSRWCNMSCHTHSLHLYHTVRAKVVSVMWPMSHAACRDEACHQGMVTQLQHPSKMTKTVAHKMEEMKILPVYLQSAWTDELSLGWSAAAPRCIYRISPQSLKWPTVNLGGMLVAKNVKTKPTRSRVCSPDEDETASQKGFYR